MRRVRSKGEIIKDSVFPALYSIFFLGFFLFPTAKIISNFYYLAIAFPFLGLVLLKKIRSPEIVFGRVFWLSALFIVYMWLTLFWSKDFSAGEVAKQGRRSLYILCFIASTTYLVNSRHGFLRRLMVVFCWTAAAVSLGYSVYYYIRYPFPEYRLVGYGLLRNPIVTSSIYGTAFIACLYLIYQNREKHDRFVYAALSVPIFSYMLLTQSRGPLIAMVATMLGWQAIILSRSGLKRGLSGKFTFLLICLLLAIAATIILVPEFYEYFILERGLSYRVEIWGKFLDMIGSAPWIGHGFNADTNTVMSDGTRFLHPHSVYLSTFYFGGAIGLILQLAMIGYCLFISVKLEKRHESFFITCLLLFGAFCIATDGYTLVHHPKPFWIFFWFPVALSAAYDKMDS